MSAAGCWRHSNNTYWTRTYQQSQVLRKKDILKDIIFPLIDKLDKSEKMYWAKSIWMK